MSLITSPEFFINIKSIPDENSIEYDDFFENERRKMEEGVTINGVFIPGWLYFYTNHWNILIDSYDERLKESFKVESKPFLRDSDWQFSELYERAREEKKGIIIVGARNSGKSYWEGSAVGRYATLFKNSECVVTAGNSPDLSLVTEKIDVGLRNIHPYFRYPRIEDNWKKQVVLGFKDEDAVRFPWSKITLRNFKDGTDTEATAGTRAKVMVIDEIGKFPVKGCFNAAKATFASQYGWMCVPILAGTGGSFEKGSDAESMFNNPDAYNLLSIFNKEENRSVGFFISAKQRMEALHKTTLAKRLEKEEGSELDLITFWQADEELALKITHEARDKAAQASDQKTLFKEIMYYPISPAECFLSDTGNDFPIEAIREQIKYLETNKITGQYVELHRDLLNNVIHRFSDKRPVTDWPVNSKTRKDAPIVIWEFPIMQKPPWGLYVAGADPYNQSSSEWSESLGSVYIYKRMLDISGEFYVNTEVACYTARPGTMNEWHEQVELLLEYYNAVCFPENEAGTFIQYFDDRKKSHYLADGMNFIKSFNPTTKTMGRIKGAAANPRNIAYMMARLVEYTKEKIQVGTDESGNPIFKMGVCRIKDKMLLKEMLGFNNKAKVNTDRIVAFRHALSYAGYLDKIMPIIYVEEKQEVVEEKKRLRSPFVNTTISNTLSRNPFPTWKPSYT